MKNLRIFFCLIVLFGSANAVSAQDARISKMTRIDKNGNKLVYGFSYDEKNRIQQVDYFTSSGALNISLNGFSFDNSNRPLSYKINYVREGGKGDVVLRYDNRGRLAELKRTVDGETFTYTYSYTGDIITEVTTKTVPIAASNNKLIFYNESGDYIETTTDAAAQKITSVIKLSANRNPVPHAGILTGGFAEPTFLGIQANGSDPRIIDTKDALGRVVLREISFTGGTKKIAYEYAAKKINADNKTDSIKVKPNIPLPTPKTNTYDPASVTPPANPPAEVTQSKTSILQGKLFYRYKTEDEKPVSKDFNLQTGYKTTGVKKGGLPVMGTTVFYPSYIADQRFPKTEEYNTKPLKKVRIMLVYQVLATKTITPARYENYLLRNWGIADGTKQEEYYMLARTNPVIWQGETAADGSFAISFNNDYALGYLGSFKEDHFVANLKHYKNGAGDHNGGSHASLGTMYMHGVLRLVVADNDYYSPEILMLPEPGETVKIPDEVALVNSFSLKVKVVTDTSMDQAVSSGAPLTNYPVKAGALKSMLNDPSAPFEARQQDMKGAADVTADGEKFMLYDDLLTDGNGEINFKNFCYTKSHVIKAPESMYDGSFVYRALDRKLAAQYSDQMQRDSLQYNSEFTPPVKTETLVLKPKLPELYLRAITNVSGQTKGLWGVKVALKKKILWFNVSSNYVTQKDGYLQVKDLPVQYGTENIKGKTHLRIIGPERSLELSMPGYKTVKFPAAGKGEILQLGQRWPKPTEIIMTGDASLTGSVENASGEAVISDLKVGDGPFIKTKKNWDKSGFFFVSNCEAGNHVRIIVSPSVDQYFSDTLYANIPAGSLTKLPTIILKEKLHRVIFKVLDPGGKPVANAELHFNNSTENISTNALGITKTIAIASPGKEFNIRIKAKGFVDYDDYVIVPVNKEAKLITVYLTKGMVISGNIKDAKTNKPIANARVYTISGYNDDGEIQLETYTDANGHYDLQGIPQKGYFLNPATNKLSTSSITVYAVKSGSPAYVQNFRIVKSADYAHADLDLEPFDCKSEIWGLPVEITSVQQKGNSIKISGAFVKIPANTSFRTARPEARLPFKDIEIKTNNQKELGGLKTLNGGGCSLEPVKNIISTEVSELKIIAFDQFNCALTGEKSGRGYENLEVTKSKSGCGLLRGFVETKLESFNFSYKYTGSFLLQPLYTGTNVVKNAAKKNEMIDVAGSCAAIADKYRLSADEDHQTFYVNNFSANFRTADSYVVKDTFSLGVSADIDIPLLKDKSINAGNIKITQNGIMWQEYAGDIFMALETWTIKGKGLQYDKNMGGFRIGNAVLQTNLPALPLKTLVIKPKLLEIGNENFNSSEGISLAGVRNLKISNSKLSLVCEQSAPQDHKPHWRINLTNDNGPAAYLDDVPGLKSGDRINVILFSNYSDGKKTLNLDQAPHDFFGVMKQYVSDIEIGSDYFTLIGRTDLGIPGCNTNITGRFRYMNDKTGKPYCTAEKLNTDAELSGKVFFSGKQTLSDYTLREGYFSANGTAILYQKTKEDGISLSATLIKTPGLISMKLDKGQLLPIGAKEQKIIIDTGLAVVKNSKWENLKFTARLDGYKAVDQNRNKIDFVVQGAILNDKDSDKKIGIDNIQTPFGGMAISFDFTKKIFAGSLNINTAVPVPPYFIINSGVAAVQLDPKGFIISGAFDHVDFTPLPSLSDFKCGLAIGYYSTGIPENMAANLRSVTVRNAIPESLKGGLKGIYLSLSKGYHNSIETPFFGTPKAVVDLGLEVITIVDFSQGFDAKIEGYCKAAASCSVEVLDCNNYVEVHTSFNPLLQYSTKSGLTMTAAAELGGHARICPLPEFGATLKVKVGIEGGDFIFSPSIF